MKNSIHEYCDMCHNCIEGRCRLGKACHGRQFYIKWDNSGKCRAGCNQFAYIPKYIEHAFTMVEEGVASLDHLTPKDSNRIGMKLLILEYKGKGERQTLVNLGIWMADIGTVGETYADIFLKECLTDPNDKPHPIRVKRKGNRAYILKWLETSNKEKEQ